MTNLNASRKQVAKNVAVSYVGLFVATISGLFITPIVLHHLGDTEFGLMATLSSAAGYVALLESGVSTAVVQRVSRLLASNDEQAVVRILGSATLFFLASIVLTIIIVISVTPFLGRIYNLPSGLVRTAQVVAILDGIGVCIGYLSNVPAAALYGSGRGYKLGAVGVANVVIDQIALVTIATLGGGLIGITLSSASVVILKYAAMSVVARRNLGFYRLVGPRFERDLMRDLIRSGRRNASLALATTLAVGLDATIIALILPVSAVTPYVLAATASGLATAVATRGTDTLLPNFSHVYSAVGASETQRLFSASLLAALFLYIPLAVALIAFGHPLLDFWLGHPPVKTYELLVLMLLVGTLQIPGRQSELLLTAVDQNRITARVSLVSSIANVAISLVATYKVGVLGPIIGSAVQALAIDVVFTPSLVVKTLQAGGARLWPDVYRPAIVTGACATATAVTVSSLAGGLSRSVIVFACVPGVVVISCTISLLLLRSNPYIRELHAHVRAVLGSIRVRNTSR